MNIRARQIATSGALLLIENVIRLGAIAAVSCWIAWKLGPSQFGILNFASALTAILFSAATLGMDAPVILRLTRTKRPGAIAGAALLIRTISGVLATTVASGYLTLSIYPGLRDVGYMQTHFTALFQTSPSL